MSSYTLWLMPDGEAYKRLQSLISDLSTVHNTPRFEPHVTLLSGITDPLATAINKTKQLASAFAPLQASLTRIEYLETYYRCLFFRTDDSETLFDIRQAAEDTFEHTPINPFIPHVSFLYGAMPVFQKEAIIAQMGEHFFMNLGLSSLRLVETNRTPEEWRLLAQFDLAANK